MTMSVRRTFGFLLLAGFELGCASRPLPPVAEWAAPATSGLTGPDCAPRPGAFDSDRSSVTSIASERDSVAMTYALEAGMRALDSTAREDFVTVEGLACRLLRDRRITTARYDAFLDSTVASALARDVSARLAAPTPSSPQNGATFDVFPRTTTLRWAPVPGARGYVVEVQAASEIRVVGDTRGRADGSRVEWTPERGGLHAYPVAELGIRFDFVGAQPGRWRVRAIDMTGRAGVASPWRRFRYLR